MSKIVIDTERCKGCCLCIEVCTRKLISVSDHPNAAGYYPVRFRADGECIACALCGLVCPDTAIEVFRDDKKHS